MDNTKQIDQHGEFMVIIIYKTLQIRRALVQRARKMSHHLMFPKSILLHLIFVLVSKFITYINKNVRK